MQIVIDISEKQYEIAKEYVETVDDKSSLAKAIVNGVPLPKGHGRLFDEKDIINAHDNYELSWLNLDAVKPILEADKAESEVKR